MSCISSCCSAFVNWFRCRSHDRDHAKWEIDERIAASRERWTQARKERDLQDQDAGKVDQIELGIMEGGGGESEQKENRSEPIRDEPILYSRKGLPATDKLAKQLYYALRDPEGGKKGVAYSFEVDLPEIIFERWERSEYDTLVVGEAQYEGARNYQEDRLLKKQDILFHLDGEPYFAQIFGVFDGHKDLGKAGEFLIQHLGTTLSLILTKLLEDSHLVSDEIITNALTQTFEALSKSYWDSGGKGGTTAACAFVYDKRIYFANVGDSRIILVKKESTYQLTEDAAGERPRFQKWHRRMGNEIRKNRIYPPGLNVARDVGAHQEMCSRPKMTRIFIDVEEDDPDRGRIYCHKGDYLVLATDGLSRMATVDEVGDAIRKLASEGISPYEMANQIAKKAARDRFRSDNVTVVVVAI